MQAVRVVLTLDEVEDRSDAAPCVLKPGKPLAFNRSVNLSHLAFRAVLIERIGLVTSVLLPRIANSIDVNCDPDSDV